MYYEQAVFKLDGRNIGKEYLENIGSRYIGQVDTKTGRHNLVIKVDKVFKSWETQERSKSSRDWELEFELTEPGNSILKIEFDDSSPTISDLDEQGI